MTTMDFDALTTIDNSDRNDETRMAEAVGITTDVRYCACGCGEALKSDAKWTYIRGHKLASLRRDELKDPDPPKDSDKKAPVFPGTQLPKAVKDDLEAKLEFFLTLIAMGWETKDPMCGGEFSSRTNQIADKLVPIIAKSPELLKWFTASGNISVWLDLAMVLWPVAKMVGQHHILHSIDNPELSVVPNDFQYPV